MAMYLYANLCRKWVVLPGPPLIEVTSFKIKSVLIRGAALDLNLCNGIVRSLRSIEAQRCIVYGDAGARLFITPDWAVRAFF